MKRLAIYPLLALTAATVSCNKFQELAAPMETDYIRFSAGDGIAATGTVETKAMENEITCDITDWEYVEDSTETKASLTETLSGSVGVFGYNFTTWESTVKPTVMYNMKNTVKDGSLTPETKVLWKNYKSGSLRFYAYAPYGKFTLSSEETGGVPYLTYTVPTTNKEQIDILYAQSADVAYTNREAVPLQFHHAMTAVQFRLGIDDAALTSVTISGVNSKGQLALDGTWSDQKATASYSIAHKDSLLIMVPQTVPTGAKISLTYNDGTKDNTIEASIAGQVWEKGKKVFYTLKKKAPADTSEYIYFDFTAGDIILTNTTYKGHIYVNGADSVVSGKHTNANKYYIYQSAPSDSVTTGNESIMSPNTGYKSVADFQNRRKVKARVPQYQEISIGGKTWGEYITNNTDPAAVLATWNNKSICPENFLEPGTPHRILISGDAEFDITLDRVYSRYFPYRGSTNGSGEEYKGVVTTAPRTGSGDTRQYYDVYGGITIGQSSLTQYNKSWTARSYREKVALRLKGNNYFS